MYTAPWSSPKAIEGRCGETRSARTFGRIRTITEPAIAKYSVPRGDPIFAEGGTFNRKSPLVSRDSAKMSLLMKESLSNGMTREALLLKV